MVSNKTGALIIGGSALGLLYLGSKGSADGQEAFFGGGGSGGFFSGQDEGNITTVQDEPTESPFQAVIDSFLGPASTESTSDSGSFDSGSSKKSNTYSTPSFSTSSGGLKIFTDDSGNIIGGEDSTRMMSLSAEGTKKAINSALSDPNTAQFQGPVRPSDNESIFRLTGASTGGSSNRSSSSGGSSSSSKKSLKTDSLSGKDKGKGSYTVTKSDGSKSKRFFQ